MPVPEVEEVTSDVKGHPFRNAETFGQRDILVVVAESSQVGNAGPRAVVEVELVHRLKSRDIEERFIRVEVAFVLGERVGPRQDGRNTCHRKLAGDIALATPEVERGPTGGAENS